MPKKLLDNTFLKHKKKPGTKAFRRIFIEFWDHSQATCGMSEPIKCFVIGWLLKETKLHYSIATWLTEEGPDENTDSYAILRKAIISEKFW